MQEKKDGNEIFLSNHDHDSDLNVKSIIKKLLKRVSKRQLIKY